MVFWIALGVLSLIAVAALIWPLTRQQQSMLEWQSGAQAIYADQLKEVERDVKRGLIRVDDAQAAVLEIKRRMLAVSRGQEGGAELSRRAGRNVVVLTALAAPLIAMTIYFTIGAPGTPSLAFADRQEEQTNAAEISDLTTRLLERLTTDPEGGPTEGWVLLAQTYMRMGQYEDAVNAIGNVVERPDVTSAIMSQYAEALVAREDGIVTPKAARAIDRAREINPDNPAAVYYKAIFLDQSGDGPAAHDLLVAHLNSADTFAPWMEVFVAQANQIGEAMGRPLIDLASFAPMVQQDAPGPTASDMAAASDMSEQDRSAFIRSMVERLATRLESEPDDLDGWMRLAKAYGVLGEVESSRNAFLRANDLAENLSSDDPRLSVIAAGIANTDDR